MSLLISTVRRSGGALAPVFTSSPAISGTYSIGSVLTCAPGTWTGTEPVTPTYQWQRNGTSIGGATASTYTLVGADMIGTVTCAVAITNSAGFDVDTSNGLSWADYVSTLGARVWLDAQDGTHLVMSGSSVDSATDLSGEGNSAGASGARRPTYDPTAFGGRGGMLFAGTQYLESPSFAVASGSTSGCCYWHPTTAGGALSYGVTWPSQHVALFAISGGMRHGKRNHGRSYRRHTCGIHAHRVVWRTVEGGATRVIIDGVVYTGSGAGTATATSDTLKIGIVSPPTFYRLTGTIGEVIFADDVWSDAEMSAVDAALAARWT